jgi:hypothetical protein
MQYTNKRPSFGGLLDTVAVSLLFHRPLLFL